MPLIFLVWVVLGWLQIVAAHTGGGEGFFNGLLSVYVAPYVAIGEQVKDSLTKLLDHKLSLVSMFGAFRSEALEAGAHSELVVATPERFDAWLRVSEAFDRLRTVVFDEMHIVENGARGARVEGIITRLRLLQQTHPRLRIVGLSAVLAQPQAVCDWLGVEAPNLHQVSWRPTARRLAVCLADGRLKWIHGNDALRPLGVRPNADISQAVVLRLPEELKANKWSAGNEELAARNVAHLALDMRKRLGRPGLVVCARKVDTRLISQALVAQLPERASPALKEAAARILAQYSWLRRLAEGLKHGIAFHNASLPFDVRREIEQLTRSGALDIVCATTTLAEGADLPFRWTVVAHWQTPTGDGATPLKAMTFRNIAGRCGRAGAFVEGDTILFENLLGPPALNARAPSPERLDSVMFSSAPLGSAMDDSWYTFQSMEQAQVKAAYAAQLLACVGEHPQAEDVASWFGASSYASRAGGAQVLRTFSQETLSNMLDANLPGGALAVANSPIRLTPFGLAANRSGFSPSSCRQMVQFLQHENFGEGVDLFVAVLLAFYDLPEQSNSDLVKIASGNKHRHPIREEDLPTVVADLLAPMKMHAVFERLRSKRRSKAGEKSVEGYLDKFVFFVNSVMNRYLPWTLRALGHLAPFGSKAAQALPWASMARDIESTLRQANRLPDEEDDVEL